MVGNLAYNICISVSIASAAISVAGESVSTNSVDSASNVPRILLDEGTFNGIRNDSIDRFLGIPYSKPTWGDLRYRLPVANDPYTGEHNVTKFGYPCLQQTVVIPLPDALDPQARALLASGIGDFSEVSDDCLSVNVYKPSQIQAYKKLPVVIWIHGGGFAVGGSSEYDGSGVVRRSIELGEPVIFVSLNYRLAAYGFLNGAEVEAAGVANLGLQDQRQAFRWVQKYIGAFGGDRHKVTIWGQSAGAMSVGHHMIANGGKTEGLFHAAFMESGSPLPYGDTRKGQEWYNSLVNQSGCANTSESLVCLRETVPAEVIDAIQDHDPTFFNETALHLVWVPRADGNFLRDLPYQAVSQGEIANIPFVSGDTDDEGTVFTVPLLNVTTDDEVHAYIASNYFPDASAAEIDKLLKFYPQDVSQGSPFDTGNANAVTTQYKRLAAIQADLNFHSPRRFLLQHRSGRQSAWSYLWKRFKSTPDLGSFHGSDLSALFGEDDLGDYLINFVNHHNPNGKGNATWPQYTPANPTVFTFLEGNKTHTLAEDNFRAEGISYLNQLLIKYPL
ncbi:carotenoid ester lipase precursor [Irpex lacteus]|nr:carotenoid ester lipase precursor [Irpex lacteus]